MDVEDCNGETTAGNRANVMVLGAGGVGEVVAVGLCRIPGVRSVWVADVNQERAQEVVAECNDPRATAIYLDAGDQCAVTKAIRDCDCGLLIHVGIPRFNFSVMEACLEAGCSYIDTASDGPVELPGLVTIQQQLTYDERFRARGLLALMGMGADPGVTNILARYAYDRMQRVEELIVFDGDNSIVKDNSFAIAFSPETSIEECLQPPLLFQNGGWTRGEPLTTGIEEFRFPDPVGSMTVRSVAHEETFTMPHFLGDKGLRYCDFKYALSDQYVDILKGLQVIGLDREEPVQVSGVSVVPRQVVASLLPKPADLWESMEGTSCIGVLVKGTDLGGLPVETYYYTIQSQAFSHQDMGVNLTVFQAGIPPVVAAEMLLDGTITAMGARSPEELDPEPWLERLPRWGMPLFRRRVVTESL